MKGLNINVYVIKNSTVYGKPIFYENDKALKIALKAMYDELIKDESAALIRDSIAHSVIYKIGEFDPILGKVKSCIGKRLVGTLVDIVKGEDLS